MDMRNDLERIDRVVTQVISDPATAQELIRDPSGVLSRLGLHPPASRDTHDRVNRIFYAVLTNTELINFVIEQYTSEAFRERCAPALEENSRAYLEGLSRGEFAHSVELDVVVADFIFGQTDVLRRIHQLSLYDLNNRGLLQNTYTTEQLDDYIDRLVESIQAREPISQRPVLEVWEDPHYGVGTEFGVASIEVDPVVTVGILVEFGVALTVAIPVLPAVVEPETIDNALRGDPESVRMVATAGRLLQFSGEVLTYVSNFERG
jgi:hypothetical protein